MRDSNIMSESSPSPEKSTDLRAATDEDSVRYEFPKIPTTDVTAPTSRRSSVKRPLGGPAIESVGWAPDDSRSG